MWNKTIRAQLKKKVLHILKRHRSYSEYHHRQKMHTTKMIYKAVLYREKFDLPVYEISDRMCISAKRVYDLIKYTRDDEDMGT